jgi:hypothetical protein
MTAAPPDPRFVVPAYFHPAVRPADWQRLALLAGRLRLVVLNIGDGPGRRPDAAFRPALALLAEAGVPVAGYVDTGYGAKSCAAALRELDCYRRWYGVPDVFFDRVPAVAEHAGHYAELAGLAHLEGARTVAFNHGAHPAEEYAEHADLLGTFEGPWPAYRGLHLPAWVRAGAPERFFHLVHSVVPRHFADVLGVASASNVGGVYLTDRAGANPWDQLSDCVAGTTGQAARRR